jgi:hypothetical protein
MRRCIACTKCRHGTTTPNNSAIVDITTASKGLLLPRLADTASVANPVRACYL